MKKICFIVILVSLMLVSCKPEPEMATVITKEVTSITSVSAKVIGSVTDDGGVEVMSRGVCWSTNVDPTIDNAMSMGASSGIGNFECEIKGLEPNTTYYVKAYATNSVGLSYGEQKEFVTQEKEYLIEVITNEISNVTQTTAQCGGNIKYEGEETIEARGVCWSTSPEPTIDDFCTVDGSGVGGFISNMTGLTDNTLYYVKAYAKVNDVVTYGEQKSFRTGEQQTIVTTYDVMNITINSATCGGEITSTEPENIHERGICYSTTPEPDVYASCVVGGIGDGSFICNMTGLTDNTLYYVKAYAKVNDVVTYGEQKSFRTGEQQTIVTTYDVMNITINSATCGGEITSTEPENIHERGICYSTTPEPDVYASCVVGGAGDGSFTCNMTGLTDNTLYYVKAYAKVNDVVTYGEQKTFTTVKDIYAPDGNIGGYEYVDLGLPSGLKWATHNVGANAPEKYGNYFSWGEISPKNEYNTSSTMGVQMTDFSGNPQYDAATSNWGDTWRMPTKAEMEELMTLCEWNSVQKDGVVGVKVTGPNGNCLFLPAAGHAYGPWIYFVDYGCYYWSSSPYDSSENIFAYFLSYDVYTGFYEGMAHSERLYGLPIRPVSE